MLIGLQSCSIIWKIIDIIRKHSTLLFNFFKKRKENEKDTVEDKWHNFLFSIMLTLTNNNNSELNQLFIEEVIKKCIHSFLGRNFFT